MGRIGKVAYRLRLQLESKIHLVFHVSQLKVVIGSNHVVLPLPSQLTDVDGLVIQPEEVVDTRYNNRGCLELLIKWVGLPVHKLIWNNKSW